MIEPEVPCRIMETRRCEDLFEGELLERDTQCPVGECFRFQTDPERVQWFMDNWPPANATPSVIREERC